MMIRRRLIEFLFELHFSILFALLLIFHETRKVNGFRWIGRVPKLVNFVAQFLEILDSCMQLTLRRVWNLDY